MLNCSSFQWACACVLGCFLLVFQPWGIRISQLSSSRSSQPQEETLFHLTLSSGHWSALVFPDNFSPVRRLTKQTWTGHTLPFLVPFLGALLTLTLPWVSEAVSPQKTSSSRSWIQLIAPFAILWTLKRGDHWLQLLPLMVNESLILGAAVFWNNSQGS